MVFLPESIDQLSYGAPPNVVNRSIGCLMGEAMLTCDCELSKKRATKITRTLFSDELLIVKISVSATAIYRFFFQGQKSILLGRSKGV